MTFKRSAQSARAMLMDLVIGCPRGNYSKDCLLYDTRTLTLSEKHKWLLSLPDDALVDIYSAHLECLNSKDLFVNKELLRDVGPCSWNK